MKTSDMTRQLRSYKNGVHGDFFMAAAAVLEGQAEKLQHIRSVCTGESQVADDDTEALQYIVDLIDDKHNIIYTATTSA